MELNSLTAISPIDGRYHAKTSELRPFFSEYALIKYRVIVEIKYLIALAVEGIDGMKDFPKDRIPALEAICTNFSEADANWIKDKEKITNHDVKAVEYFGKEKMRELNLNQYLE
ncbi:MAG: adenylosuccinate lyase, partial [Bacteroidota bacterium]